MSVVNLDMDMGNRRQFTHCSRVHVYSVQVHMNAFIYLVSFLRPAGNDSLISTKPSL